MDPREEKPQGQFVGAPNPALRGTVSTDALPPQISGPFRLNLISNGNPIGQLGVITSGINKNWCIVVPAGQGLVMSMYYYRGNSYIRQANDSKSYLSVSTRAYAGFYAWASAYPAAETHEGWLNCAYAFNHQNLSFYSMSDGYLYFWNSYSVLTVEPVAA